MFKLRHFYAQNELISNLIPATGLQDDVMHCRDLMRFAKPCPHKNPIQPPISWNMYLWSNKCSLGEHITSFKTLKN